ncbi:MAG: DNA helicase [Pseudomonadales bacterium]
MRLSAPIYRLKRQARVLSRSENIPHHEALDRVAQREGFDSWSLLANRTSANHIGKSLIKELELGDLLLVGARPGQGKTLLSLEIAVEAMRIGHRSVFFSLDYTEVDVADRFADLGQDLAEFKGRFEFDGSEDICASYMINHLASAPAGTVIVVDYLQLLDQRRENPDLMEQVKSLRAFAKERKLILVFISQIRRDYDGSRSSLPRLRDVRLPNPLDLAFFDKTCFLNAGEIEFAAVG